MDKNELIRACEAVVFSSGEPVSVKRIAEVFELTPKKAEELLKNVEEHIASCNLGFELLWLEDSVQLASKQAYAQSIKTALAIKRKAPLSPAALEVLAVIAYNQPSTKAFIEQVRGVDCSGVLSTLIEKELIEEIGRLELPGRPLLYGTTKNFLRCFQLKSLDDLPPLPESEQNKEIVAEQLEVRPDI